MIFIFLILLASGSFTSFASDLKKDHETPPECSSDRPNSVNSSEGSEGVSESSSVLSSATPDSDSKSQFTELTRGFSQAEFLAASQTPAGFLTALRLDQRNHGVMPSIRRPQARLSVPDYQAKAIEQAIQERLRELPSLQAALDDSEYMRLSKQLEDLRVRAELDRQRLELAAKGFED